MGVQKIPSLSSLVTALRVLPGIGAVSAERIALELVAHAPLNMLKLADALTAASQNVQRCQKCRMLCEGDECWICLDENRDDSMCVVDKPADVFAIEATSTFRGRYFVLHGCLSPLDGIEAEDLGLDALSDRVESGGVSELIVALPRTLEGDVTADWISMRCATSGDGITRLAVGIPQSSALDSVDVYSLAQAIKDRRPHE